MIKIRPYIGGLGMFLAASAASAGMHQICYEGISQTKADGTSVPTGIFGCSMDGGTCTITRGAYVTPSAFEQALKTSIDSSLFATNTFAFFDFPNVATFTATIDFFRAATKVATRVCSVNVQGNIGSDVPGNASGGAILSGFSTDASGLVTTGVWTLVATAAFDHNELTVITPHDFVVVGGGAMAVNEPDGAFISKATYDDGAHAPRSWIAGTSDGGGIIQLHNTTAFAIGMRIEGMDGTAVPIQLAASSGPTKRSAPIQVMSASGRVVLGGGIAAVASNSSALAGPGQYATIDSPLTATRLQCTYNAGGAPHCAKGVVAVGWRAASTDFIVSRPGSATVQMLTLPNSISVNGVDFDVVGKVIFATAIKSAKNAAIDVRGLRGE
jgi:hypothetical protein